MLTAFEVHVNKHKKYNKRRTLELKKETVVNLTVDLLTDDQLKDVVGGNNSTRLSQCPTLCFT